MSKLFDNSIFITDYNFLIKKNITSGTYNLKEYSGPTSFELGTIYTTYLLEEIYNSYKSSNVISYFRHSELSPHNKLLIYKTKSYRNDNKIRSDYVTNLQLPYTRLFLDNYQNFKNDVHQIFSPFSVTCCEEFSHYDGCNHNFNVFKIYISFKI
jgi:hypothetical protein